MLGFAYHRMGLYRDAEKQLTSSLKTQPTIVGCMLLAKVRRIMARRPVIARVPLNTTYFPLFFSAPRPPLRQVFIRLDQPQNAVRCYRQGLEAFSEETVLLAGVARIQEAIGNMTAAVAEYERLLKQDRSV